MEVAKIVMGWIMVVFIGALAVVVLWKILNGTIDLNKLISEENGDASMSRFQFLVFTFVVASMWIYAFFCNGGCNFIDVPKSALGLLGISGGSYVVSKGIQKNFETEKAKADSGAERTRLSVE